MDKKRHTTGPKRSRRELLAGAAGAAGVIAAQTVIGAQPAYAGTDGDVVLGADNQMTSGATGVQSTNITGLHGRSTAGGGTGVFGEDLASSGIGVHGTGAGPGVVGDSANADGVRGVTGGGGSAGVHGFNNAGGVGVWGEGRENTSVGVFGYGWSTGVHGVGDPVFSGQFAAGVHGEGKTYAAGVVATSESGVGLEASGPTIGVHAVSAPDNTGVGLRVDGRSVFRTAGIATVASGKKSIVVNLAGVTSTDMVLATVQQTGAFSVKNAVAGSGKLTIYLNKAPTSPATVKVAWFVLSAS